MVLDVSVKAASIQEQHTGMTPGTVTQRQSQILKRAAMRTYRPKSLLNSLNLYQIYSKTLRSEFVTWNKSG